MHGLPQFNNVPYSTPRVQYHPVMYNVNNNHNNAFIHNQNQMLMQQKQFQKQQLRQPHLEQPQMSTMNHQFSNIWPNFNAVQHQMQMQQSLFNRQEHLRRQRQLQEEDAA